MPNKRAANGAESHAKKAKVNPALESPHRPARLCASPGYLDSELEAVQNILREKGWFGEDTIQKETGWFFFGLGIDQYYFATFSAEEKASHLLAIIGAKLNSLSGAPLDINLRREDDTSAMYACSSVPGSRSSPAMEAERRLEQMYLGEGYRAFQATENDRRRFRLQCYRTAGAVQATDESKKYPLRIYFLTKPNFRKEDADPSETDINEVGDLDFLQNSSKNTRKLYQSVLEEVVQSKLLGPAVQVFEPSDTELRLVIGYRSGTTHSFLSGLSTQYHYYNLYSTRKYVEQFSNGITILSIYLSNVDTNSTKEDLRKKVQKMVDQLSTIYILPRTAVSSLFREGQFSANHTAYAYVGWKFAYHFINRSSAEFDEVMQVLGKKEQHAGLLRRLKKRLRKDMVTEGRIIESIKANPELLKELYDDFESFHCPSVAKKGFDPQHNDALMAKIKKLPSEIEQLALSAFLTLNRYTVKTNFYKARKVAISFRLDPSFLNSRDFPKNPYGLFFVVGSEFRGFHVRFSDVARGGIRLIRSANDQAYNHNVETLFDENYNLALTQHKKNKDIPEGGSKGTILLTRDHQQKGKSAFEKYVDSIFDLLLPNEEVVDHLGKEEILFFGPDEGTADYMNWASARAKSRGYNFWRAFTTGKSPAAGGIPHDLYGMTTRSVHQYVLGILRKTGIKEETITKIQTGGPDGDLGSNEIKISKDKTIAVVDGSGVLFDPSGLDRVELNRLAEKRVMSCEFNLKKLSKDGAFVGVKDVDVTLPDGTNVESGLQFRNSFHVSKYAKSDLFVPCGGRPESVDATTVHKLIDDNGVPNFKYVVEGANLFFTQEARLALEDAGVIIIKDASANKGGVTSSSLEVLAALAFNDEEFAKHMQVENLSNPPKFFEEYVKDVHRIIERNADNEFECIWREKDEKGSSHSRPVLTDLLSMKIVGLEDSIESSHLWNNEGLRSRVLKAALPKPLLDILGLDVIMKRVPEQCLRAMFGGYIASHFVYKYGLTAPEFAFVEFMDSL